MLLLFNVPSIYWRRRFVCTRRTFKAILVSQTLGHCLRTIPTNNLQLLSSFSGNCYRQQVQSLAKANENELTSRQQSCSFAAPSAVRNTQTLSASTAKTSPTTASSQTTTKQNIPLKTQLPHSIRLIEIPWTKGAKGGIRLSIDDCQMIDASMASSNNCPGVRISE